MCSEVHMTILHTNSNANNGVTSQFASNIQNSHQVALNVQKDLHFGINVRPNCIKERSKVNYFLTIRN